MYGIGWLTDDDAKGFHLSFVIEAKVLRTDEYPSGWERKLKELRDQLQNARIACPDGLVLGLMYAVHRLDRGGEKMDMDSEDESEPGVKLSTQAAMDSSSSVTCGELISEALGESDEGTVYDANTYKADSVVTPDVFRERLEELMETIFKDTCYEKCGNAFFHPVMLNVKPYCGLWSGRASLCIGVIVSKPDSTV